ncbi:four helix bundle protein [candidate division KSB1 bacterium]|nr:MAG: four helix bundle protein [candidate division KSB1 bacterium]
MKAQTFEDLLIWQNARTLVGEIYRHSNKMKDYGFRDQIQRAAVSTMNNIAEGFERNSDMDFKRFLCIAKASCGEVRSMLYLSEDLNYLEPENANYLRHDAAQLSSKIASLIKYLKTSKV